MYDAARPILPSAPVNGAADAPALLILDRDSVFGLEIRAFLQKNTFSVDYVGDMRSAENLLRSKPYDLVVMQASFGPQGLAACRSITSAYGVAVVVLSGWADSTERVIALELGADALLARPCDTRELLASIRAILRRMRGPAVSHITDHSRSWHMDGRRRILRSPEGADVHLTATEYRLLAALIESPDGLVTYENAGRLLGSDPNRAGGALRSLVTRLRRKFGGEVRGEAVIRTLTGEGYFLDVPVALR